MGGRASGCVVRGREEAGYVGLGLGGIGGKMVQDKDAMRTRARRIF